jgi:hypothetical protein
MTALTTDPHLFWVLLLVCTCFFALGAAVGWFAYRFVVGPQLRARDEAISAAIVAVYPVMARDVSSLTPAVWESFAVQAGRFVAMARAVPDVVGFRK